MSANRVEQEIREFLLRRPRGKAIGKLGVDDSLFALGILDSMGVVSLVAFCEESFGIVIDDEELVPENFQTLGALVELVRRSERA